MSRKIDLPRNVHRVVSRGREYFYYQAGRSTPQAGPRVRLPNDPRTPEFWHAVRQAAGVNGTASTGTINALCDSYELAWPGLPRKLSKGTQDQYRRNLKPVRDAWGDLQADQLRPSHVQALIEKIGATKPGTANNTLDALKAMCRWATGPRELLQRDPTHGVQRFQGGEGHKPWTAAQLRFADEKLTGVLRRAYMLARYTGQRASDIVRLSSTDVDGGGFNLPQKKTGVRPWCPIFPELEVEMSGWEKRPGPFLLQDSGKGRGKPFTTNQLWKVFDSARGAHPELDGAIWHGLRANAVIRLRQEGYTGQLISDMVGMSVEMIERYCRYADRKAGGQAVLRQLRERKQDEIVNRQQNAKQKY